MTDLGYVYDGCTWNGFWKRLPDGRLVFLSHRLAEELNRRG